MNASLLQVAKPNIDMKRYRLASVKEISSGLAAEFEDDGEDKTIFITGIFTPEKTEQSLIQELSRKGINVMYSSGTI